MFLIESKRSLTEILPIELLYIESLCRDLWTRSCTGPCWKDLVEVLVKCCQRPFHDLVQVLVRRFWRGPGEIPYCRCPCMISYRSLSEDLVEILLKCSALVLVWKFFWDAPKKFLYEDLVRFSYIYIHIIIHIYIYTYRKCCCCSCDHVSPHLLLFHSYCCLYLVQWLPTPHTV
jgi:hypothetical protein